MASSDEVQIRGYRAGDERGIVALLNQVFAEGNAAYRPRSEAEWRWIYADNPAGAQVVVAEDGAGDIVGHYACIPYRCQVDGVAAICGQGVDSMVRQDYRRGLKTRGLFLRTAEYFFARFGQPEVARYGYGFPNPQAFRIGVRRLAYTPVQSPLRTLGFNLYAARPALVPLEELPGSPAVQAVVDFAPGADALWARLAPEYGMAICRDARYLNWRYRDCALARYQGFALLDEFGAWRGCYVLRENWQGVPIAALAELLVPQDDVAAARLLLGHALAQARAGGQQRLELWMPPWHPWFSLCQELGMLAEDAPYHLCLKPYGEPIAADWAAGHWYYSIGDSDTF